MSDLSPRLQLPFLQPSQAQKHVTHNEALQQLDALVQLTVEGFDANTPPALPQNGEIHALGSAPTGDWAGQAGNLAVYRENSWIFVPPQEGWRAWGKAEARLQVYAGGAWGDLPVVVQNVNGVGVNAVSDATNRLAVASDASLFSHDGSDHRLKINKNASGDAASVLFQTGWSGRAEIGTIGDDDFHFKVSADGSNFENALSLRAENGVTDAKCLRSGKILINNDSVGIVPTPGACGFVLITMVHTAWPWASHSGIFVFDSGGSLLLQSMALAPQMLNKGAEVLTGTTGNADYTSVAVKAGQLQIENRTQLPRTYSYTFIGGL